MKLLIEIGSSNEAVQRAEAVSRLVRDAAQKIRDGHLSGVIRDYNGNVVGSFRYEPDEEE